MDAADLAAEAGRTLWEAAESCLMAGGCTAVRTAVPAEHRVAHIMVSPLPGVYRDY
jgi:hypothetical protein